MSCSNLTSGLSLDCNNDFSGVDKIFIANGPVQSITETSGVITAITVGGSALVPADFFTFETPRNQSSFTETINVSQDNSTVVYNQDLTLMLNKLEATKRNQILLMAEATSMVVVIKTASGKYFSLGIEKGAYLGGGSATSGVSASDKNGYELTISGLEASPMYEVTSTIVEA
jgi:hypothetical protein